MSDVVEACEKWLGIPAEEQPANHYRLLGLELFESDRATIDGAAKRLMGFLQKQLSGPDQAAIRKLLDRISDARRCLLLTDRKTAYDQRLRESLEAMEADETDEPTAVAEPIDEAFDAPIAEPFDAPAAEPIDEAEGEVVEAPLVEPLDSEAAEPVDANPTEPADIPVVEPIDDEQLAENAAPSESSATLPVSDESIPEAKPIASEEVETAAEPELIDDADEPPEPELLEETEQPPDPELLDEIDEPPAKPAAVAPAPSKPAAAQHIGDAVGSASHAEPDYGAEAGGIDGSFFSGIGLSQGGAEGKPSVAAGIGVTGKAAGKSKDPKAVAKSNASSKNPAGGKPTGAANTAEGKSTVKKPPRRGPEMWQIMVGVGGAVVILIVIAAAVLGPGTSTPTTTSRPRPAHPNDGPKGIAYGRDAFSGPIDDRTTRSPVTGTPISVPIERHGDLMLANVKINDHDAGKFLLDTGTRDVIIAADVADKLGLTTGGHKSLNVPGGVQQVTKRKINSLSLGKVRFEDSMILPPPTDGWLAIAADMKPWSQAIGVPIAGVIGCDIWSQTPVSIDPSKNMITFFKRVPFPFSTGSSPQFLTRFDFKPAMPATLDNNPEGTFLLATGVPTGVMVKGAAPVGKLTFFGEEFSAPTTVESKNGDGYSDPKEVRQSGVLGAEILSHFVLIFDFQYEKFLAVPIKK